MVAETRTRLIGCVLLKRQPTTSKNHASRATADLTCELGHQSHLIIVTENRPPRFTRASANVTLNSVRFAMSYLSALSWYTIVEKSRRKSQQIRDRKKRMKSSPVYLAPTFLPISECVPLLRFIRFSALDAFSSFAFLVTVCDAFRCRCDKQRHHSKIYAHPW
jgi:hypothetical protein